MMQTISFLRASMDRAKQEGAKSLNVSLLDLEELVRAAEAHATRELAQNAKKHAGWVKPSTLQAMLKGAISNAKIRRHRTPDHCVEIFFSGSLYKIIQEQEAKAAAEGQEIVPEPDQPEEVAL